MPPVVAAVAFSAAGGVAAGAFAISVATAAYYGTYAVYLVGTAALARRQQKKALRAQQAQIQDRRYTLRGSAEPQHIVLGRTRVGGVVLAPGWSWGTNKDRLTIPVALAGHEVHEIEDVWLAEETAGPWTVMGTTLEAGIGSKWAPSKIASKAINLPGGAAAATYAFAEGAAVTGVDSVAYEALVTEVSGGEGESSSTVWRAVPLHEGIDYTVTTPGGITTLTWLRDLTGKTLTATYRVTTADAYFSVRRFLGSPTGERAEDLETNSDGEWKDTDVGKSMARIHPTFRWNADLYPNGPPPVSAIVKGAKAYDPRLDSTNGGSGSHRFDSPGTWAWTRNPALLWAWYMTWDGGGRRPFARINWPSVIVAANVCDELVTLVGGDTQRRYQCDGVLSTADDVRTNSDKILSSMVGTRFFSGNQWYVRAGAYVTPTMVLTDDDFDLGEIKILPRPKLRDLFNSVRGTFIDAHPPGDQGEQDAGGFWSPTDFEPYVSSVYVAQDGGEKLFEDVEFPLTQDWRAAQRMAKLLLHRARQGQTISAPWKIRAMPLQPGDTVWITSEVNAWTLKVFRVVDRTHNLHGNIELILQEDAPEVYDHTFSELVTPDPAPNTNLPDPRIVRPLAGFTLSPGDSYTLPDGTVVPYATVSWDAITDSAVLSGGRVEVWWKRAVDTLYRKLEARPTDTSVRIEPVSGGDLLNLYGLVYNGSQVASPAVFAVGSLRDDLPSGAVVQPLASNRLQNATMLASVDKWSMTSPDIAALSIGKNDAYAIRGGSGNAVLSITDPRTGDSPYVIVFSTEDYSVDTRMMSFAAGKLLPVFTDAFVQIQWLDETRQHIRMSPRSNVVPDSAGRYANRREDYQLATVFDTPPPNARWARYWVVAQGNWTESAVKYLWWLEPMLADVTTALGGIPPWDPGGAQAIGTDLLVVDAATRVYRQIGTSANVPSGLDGQSIVMQGPQFVADADGTVEVSCTFTYALYGGSANAVTFTAVVFPSSTFDPKRASTTFIATVATASGPVRDTKELTDMVTVTKGQLVDCRLIIDRLAVQSDSPLGIVSKPAGERTYSIYDAISNGNWKVTHIKR